MLKKIGLLIATSISVLAMHNAEININEKDLEFGLNFDMGQFNKGVEPETTFVGLKYLHSNTDNSNDEYGKTVNTKYFVELNFLIKQEIKKSGLKFGLGVKTNFSAINDKAFMSIPIGLDVSYILPLKDIIPIVISGEVYYSPESLSFLDAASYFEYRAELRAELIERGSIFLGYRNLDTNYEASSSQYDVTYNRSLYFGFQFEF